MDKEYLEDYDQKERARFKRLKETIQGGKFVFGQDRYPPNECFVNLQEPVAVTVGTETLSWNSIWSQVPFSGSLILLIPPYTQGIFETLFFKVSEIPEVIDFVKKTGRLQIALNREPLAYLGLDYMEPFFEELKLPYYHMAPSSVFMTDEEGQRHANTFHTLASVRLLPMMYNSMVRIDSSLFEGTLIQFVSTYALLKAEKYNVTEDIENLMIDDPEAAFILLCICRDFIIDPLSDLRSDLRNYGLENARKAQILPSVYRPQPRFPCEIGKFLLQKLTYAPTGLDACKELMYHYDKYDLQKVQESLNEAITTNHPDVVNTNAEYLSEILDNVWNEKTIPRRIKGLRIGVPLSMAAIGSVAAGPIGAAGGFLAGLGFDVANELFDLGTEGLSEKLAKFKSRSYQANIYDFKKKYNK